MTFSKLYSRYIVLIYLCRFSALWASWTQQCGSVKAGVIGHTGCPAARWFWVTSNNWMPALSNVQRSWRLATIQRCLQAEPADLTLTLCVISVSVCVCVQQCKSASKPACLSLHTTAANQLDKHTELFFKPGPEFWLADSVASYVSVKLIFGSEQTDLSLNMEEWTMTLT